MRPYVHREKTIFNIAPTYTLGYFLGYNMIGSFLISLLIPVVTLGTFNTLIWRKLQQIWKNRYAPAAPMTPMALKVSKFLKEI